MVEPASIWINGGYFVLRQEIFEQLHPGEDLVVEAFQRLIQRGEPIAYAYDGFWAAMDTFRDREQLGDRSTSGQAPWMVWRQP